MSASMGSANAGSGTGSISGGGGSENSPVDCLPDDHAKTQDVQTVGFTSGDIGDAPMLPELPDQIPPGQVIGSVAAYAASDTRRFLDAIADRDASAVIPPHKNASPWKPDAQAWAPKTWPWIECGRGNREFGGQQICATE